MTYKKRKILKNKNKNKSKNTHRKKTFKQRSFRKKYSNKKYSKKRISKGGNIEETKTQLTTLLSNPEMRYSKVTNMMNRPIARAEFRQNRINQMSNLLDNPESRYANVLNAICGTNTRGECVDFGNYKRAINTYFNDFNIDKNWKYLEYIKKIGQPSANGSIIELKFNKHGYSAYAVMKMNLRSDADNLLYEYYVGKTFINKYLNIFPCFVETYGMYKIKNGSRNFLISYNSLPKDTNGRILNANLPPDVFKKINNEYSINEISKTGCDYGRSNDLGILIQHYHDLKTIEQSTNGDDIYDIYNFLFQVYFCLHCMKDSFTHYDLHTGNALAYKPYNGNKFVEMNYHLNDGTIITFPTERLMKIIDYGRAHFEHNVNGHVENTKMIVDNVCANSQLPDYDDDACYHGTPGSYETFCGEIFGMNSINGENSYDKITNKVTRDIGSFYYIHPSVKNVSHDLRLLYIIGQKININANVRFTDGAGTPEVEDVASPPISIIRNVTEAFLGLKMVNAWTGVKFVEWKTKTPSPQAKYNKYGASTGWEKMGEFHIYEDQRPYEFIPVN